MKFIFLYFFIFLIILFNHKGHRVDDKCLDTKTMCIVKNYKMDGCTEWIHTIEFVNQKEQVKRFAFRYFKVPREGVVTCYKDQYDRAILEC